MRVPHQRWYKPVGRLTVAFAAIITGLCWSSFAQAAALAASVLAILSGLAVRESVRNDKAMLDIIVIVGDKPTSKTKRMVNRRTTQNHPAS